MTESDEECYCTYPVWEDRFKRPKFVGKAYVDAEGELFVWEIDWSEYERRGVAICFYHHHEMLFRQLREATDLFL